MIKVFGKKEEKGRKSANPFGLFIVFLGPDGAGKTSVIANIESHLAKSFARTVRFHLRPHFGRERLGTATVSNPHSVAPRCVVGSWAKVMLWWLDYVSGYCGKVAPELRRSTLVIFDRYADDLAVDPKRYRYGGPRWLARLLPSVVPRPDLAFVLVADPRVIYARKAEVSFLETVRQVQAYRELAKERGMILVDAGLPIHEVAASILEEIRGWLERRDGRR